MAITWIESISKKIKVDLANIDRTQVELYICVDVLISSLLLEFFVRLIRIALEFQTLVFDDTCFVLKTTHDVNSGLFTRLPDIGGILSEDMLVLLMLMSHACSVNVNEQSILTSGPQCYFFAF